MRNSKLSVANLPINPKNFFRDFFRIYLQYTHQFTVVFNLHCFSRRKARSAKESCDADKKIDLLDYLIEYVCQGRLKIIDCTNKKEDGAIKLTEKQYAEFCARSIPSTGDLVIEKCTAEQVNLQQT